MNKYLHNGIGESEVDINIRVNNGTEKKSKKKKHCDFLFHLITAVTYGEIYKSFQFFKIKNFPIGKLNPLNMNTV